MAMRRASLSAMRSVRARGGGFWGDYPGGSFWSDGTQSAKGAGNLFGESPLAKGEVRKMEAWEWPWYVPREGPAVLHNPTPAVGMGFQGLLPSGQPPAAHSRHRHIHRDIHPAVTCISWVLPARRGGFGSVDPPENHPAARLPHSPAHALGFGRVALSPHHGPHAISKLSLCPRSTLRPCQPPGEPRRYIGMIILPSTMLTFGLYFKPETRAVAWAREEAQRQLAEAN
jgi:hypothetical protein